MTLNKATDTHEMRPREDSGVNSGADSRYAHIRHQGISVKKESAQTLVLVAAVAVLMGVSGFSANWYYNTHMSPYRPCAVQGEQFYPPYPACGLERPSR